jgi:hypothetical protein
MDQLQAEVLTALIFLLKKEALDEAILCVSFSSNVIPKNDTVVLDDLDRVLGLLLHFVQVHNLGLQAVPTVLGFPFSPSTALKISRRNVALSLCGEAGDHTTG